MTDDPPMNAPKALTEDQAKLIRELGLDAKTVTFKKRGAVLPCQITIHTEGGLLKRWILRDKASGKLKLDDESPCIGKPRREDEKEHVEATTNFPTASIYAADEKVDADAVSHGLTRGEVEAWLKERGLSEQQRAVALARHFEGKTMQAIASEVGMSKSWVAATLKGSTVRECLRHLQRGMPLPVLNVATVPSDEARTAAADAGNRWTLPEAMGFARREIDNYLPHNVNHLAALGLGKLLGSENRRLTEEQMEQIKSMSPLDTLPLLLPPGKNVADAIAAYIRLNPRALLGPTTSNLLVAALVDLLEAAHFGNFEHRFPGLLPKDNHKLAVARARKALSALVSGNQGNPREYPTHLLAHVVQIMQLALEPLQRAWRAWYEDDVPRAARLKAVRERLRAEVEELVRAFQPAEAQQAYRDAYNAELERLTDSELQSLLANNEQTPEGWKENLLIASARLAERATGISFKSFVRAWKKEMSPQAVFQGHPHQ